MKKILFAWLASLVVATGFAQSDKYVKAMEQKLAGFDTVRSSETLQDLANGFERIGEAEKNQWLPYYYAALSTVNLGFNSAMPNGQFGGNNTATIDPIADKAEKLLSKAEELSKDNSEIYIVKKMIASLRMVADVMNRYMTYGPVAEEALQKAKNLNPENPRVYVLEGIDKFQTPEQFGGSKTEAKTLFEEALKKYESFKPESSIAPNWGKGIVAYYLSQIK